MFCVVHLILLYCMFLMIVLYCILAISCLCFVPDFIINYSIYTNILLAVFILRFYLFCDYIWTVSLQKKRLNISLLVL